MLSFDYYYIKMTNLNVLCIKIRFIVIKIKVAIKNLHIPINYLMLVTTWLLIFLYILELYTLYQTF